MDIMSLDKERAGYLIDRIIIPSLKLDIAEPFYNFLEALEEEEDNVVVKKIAEELRSLLGPPMPQPSGPPAGQIYPPGARQPHGPPNPGQLSSGPPHPAQPYNPNPAQPYNPGLPNPGQLYNPAPPTPEQGNS